ncbi:MAG: NAD(P)H-flavin reductase [Legionella sp.]|nr:MAG: NAD(P)H-flavin reductase [Legionella sp.]
MSEKIRLAQVKSCTALSDSIMHLVLTLEKYLPYQAGQYLQIVLAEEALSYSIANAPLGSEEYELHIRHSPDNLVMQQLFAHIQTHSTLPIRLPYGECTLAQLDADRPILFIAVGTGFAPVNAMIEQLLAKEDPRVFELFWAARTVKDFYLAEKVKGWKASNPRFQYCSLLAEDNKKSLAAQILKQHAKDINDWQIVISGPFEMVYSTRDILLAQGVDARHLYSDAFSFEGKN